ncbi:MAG: hypothetical protein J5585_08210 [Clostridia bacterium]|nr:hypothetical protein [Clostridia bacterium]
MINVKNDVTPVCAAFPYLPENVFRIIGLFCMKEPAAAAGATEIRLRRGGALSVSVDGKNVTFDAAGNVSGRPYICTDEDIDRCADLLCGGSYHSHEKELSLGYISCGTVRAGVSTYGTYGGAVWGVDGICIRIPRDVEGCSLPLFESVGVRSMLICSPPGVGKTTLLRDAAYQLSDRYGLRTVVCDPKYELLPRRRPRLADYICGKDKADAIECAVRYMSAQVILCDELGGEGEVRAVLSAQSGGVVLIATAHADGMNSLLSRPNLRTVYESNVFEKYVFIKRCGAGFVFDACGGE